MYGYASKTVRYWLGATLAACLGLYVVAAELTDEDDFQLLYGGYYTARYDSGTALHWHKDLDQFGDEPLLDRIYAAHRNDSYVIVRAGTNFYFAFPIKVSSLREVQEKRLGPFREPELKKKMLQLTGDSTFRQVGDF